MEDVKKAEAISQMPSGQIVDQGEKKREKDRVMKKLDFLQQKILEMDGRLKKIEEEIKSEGGTQPSEKFTVDDLYVDEKEPGAAPSELGQDLLGELNTEEELSIKEFEHVMKRNGRHATRKTFINWMQKIAVEHDTIEFKKGSRGGDNKPSRLVKNYGDVE